MMRVTSLGTTALMVQDKESVEFSTATCRIHSGTKQQGRYPEKVYCTGLFLFLKANKSIIINSVVTVRVRESVVHACLRVRASPTMHRHSCLLVLRPAGCRVSGCTPTQQSVHATVQAGRTYCHPKASKQPLMVRKGIYGAWLLFFVSARTNKRHHLNPL